METIITYGIVYLLVFRLAVLLLGGLCIFGGYRLFLASWRQAGDGPATDQGGELSGKIGSSELSIKSASPGIFFAAFGAVIVIAVLAGKQPTVAYDEQQSSPQAGSQGKRTTQAVTTQAVTTARSAAVRSDPPRTSLSTDAGTATYSRLVRDLTQAVTELRTTVSLVPDNPDYRDLLARLLFALGESEKAAAEQRLAVDKVDTTGRADFQARLEIYEQAAR